MGYIMCICKEPGISQEGLASLLGLNKGAVAKGIRPLVEQGYIRRVQSEKDRRAYELYPTEKTKGLQAEAESSMESLDKILTRSMTGEEHALFKALLEKACENVIDAAGDEKGKLTRPLPPIPPRPPHHR